MLKCDLHDYLEIACMYGYRARFSVISGDVYTGTAVTTKTTAEKKEFLVIRDDVGELFEIETVTLTLMEVLTDGAQFSRIDFTA